MSTKGQRIAIIGASRGLGREVALLCGRHSLLLVSRKLDLLASLQKEIEAEVKVISMDMAQESAAADLLGELEKFRPTHLWYFAGGGPYGDYASKIWSDHKWALQVSFLTPAELLLGLLKNPLDLVQFVCVGSAVAEDSGDKGAASYAAAKHGLRGLLESMWLENPKIDLRLFSPSYLDTDMLPKNAEPRLAGKKIIDPKQAATDFCRWAALADAPKHRVLG